MIRSLDPKMHGPLGVCIHCDNRGTKKNPLRRGLCTAHHGQFTRKLKQKIDELGEDGAAVWEEELIVNNYILPSQQGRKSTTSTPFDDFDDLAATATNPPPTNDPAETDKQFLAGAEQADKKSKQQDNPKELPPGNTGNGSKKLANKKGKQK